MKIIINKKPRVFEVGRHKGIKISDCGKVWLNGNEQVTFVTKSGKEYDVAAKSWGFYATPSINARLKKEGFKTALVKNEQGRYYIMLVETSKTVQFKKYLKIEKNKIVNWLDELRN